MPDLDPQSLGVLLRETMGQGKLPYVTVVSDSMAPLIRRGDQIRLAPVSVEQLKPGDIVVYSGLAELMTHRYWGYLGQMGQKRLVTRGDRPQSLDPPIPETDLVGRVVARRRRGRYLPLTRGLGRRLNQHLARLASLEIFLFAHPITFAPDSDARLPRVAGVLHDNTRTRILVRWVRRFLYGYAVAVNAIISSIAQSKGGE